MEKNSVSEKGRYEKPNYYFGEMARDSYTTPIQNIDRYNGGSGETLGGDYAVKTKTNKTVIRSGTFTLKEKPKVSKRSSSSTQSETVSNVPSTVLDYPRTPLKSKGE